MSDDIGARNAATQVAEDFKEVMYPPAGGASLGAILGAAMMQDIFRKAGLVVVPIEPSPEMEKAFQTGHFAPFRERYRAMIDVVWPSNL